MVISWWSSPALPLYRAAACTRAALLFTASSGDAYRAGLCSLKKRSEKKEEEKERRKKKRKGKKAYSKILGISYVNIDNVWISRNIRCVRACWRQNMVFHVCGKENIQVSYQRRRANMWNVTCSLFQIIAFIAYIVARRGGSVIKKQTGYLWVG